MSFKNFCGAVVALLMVTPLNAQPVADEALCFDAFGVGAVQDGTCLPLKGKTRRIGPADLPAALSDGVANLKIRSGNGAGEAIDLAPLADADGVHTLLIEHRGPIDLAPLAGMKNLRALELKGDAALALTGLDGEMPGLVELSLSAPWGVLDLSALAHMPNLRRLRVSGVEITGQDGLSRLTRLDRAWFVLRQSTDFSALSGATALERLEISGSMGQAAVSNLSFVAALTALTHLDLPSNAIEDLSPLAGLTGLTYLALKDNGTLSDLAPLAGLTGLENLHLTETAVTDVAPLAGLARLRRLDLSDSAVRDVSPLDGLTLAFLGLKGTGLD